jgi:Spy/CpxP family protein refolding chaperone
MNFFDKNRLTFWILILLVIINVSALVTFYVANRKVDSNTLPSADVKPGAALQSELSLSPDQNSKVSEINTTYKAGSESIISSIKQKKAELLDELSKENTDTNKINTILNELGIRQNQLQHANIKQFLDLKKVCTPEQTRKLSQIYSELYGCDVQGKVKGQGNGKGMKHRHRYGQQGHNK